MKKYKNAGNIRAYLRPQLKDAITQRFGARLPEIRAVVCQQRDRPQHLSAHLLIQAQYEVLCRFCAVGLIIKNHFIFLHIQPAFQLWDLSYIYCMG